MTNAIIRFENDSYRIEEIHNDFFFFDKRNQFNTKNFKTLNDAYDYLWSL